MTEGPLRVAVVGRSVYGLHGVGGLERHLYDLIRYHLAAGWHVTLVTRPPRHPHGADPARWRLVAEHPRCAVHYVPYYTFPFAGRRGTTVLDRSTAYPWFGLRAGRVAAALVERGGADIVYGVGASVFGYARLRGRRAGPQAPLVFNPQGLEEFGGFDGRYGGHPLKGIGYLPLRAVVRATAAAADAVVATDVSIAPAVRRLLPVSPDRVRVVPNGLDVADGDGFVRPEAGRALRLRHQIPAGNALLVSVGRLEANKGFADLADALATVAPGQSWHWAVVGDGPDRARLAARVQECGIGGRVLFAGRVDDATLHAWYDAADLFVHPTRYEGSSLVTLEAMLHGRPVVATRVGGLPDKVVQGVTGWLVPPGDAPALASALDAALESRPDWPRLGAAGRALLEEHFDWRVIQTRFEEVYRDLLGRRPGV
jgi:glycogen synthase